MNNKERFQKPPTQNGPYPEKLVKKTLLAPPPEGFTTNGDNEPRMKPLDRSDYFKSDTLIRVSSPSKGEAFRAGYSSAVGGQVQSGQALRGSWEYDAEANRGVVENKTDLRNKKGK